MIKLLVVWIVLSDDDVGVCWAFDDDGWWLIWLIIRWLKNVSPHLKQSWTDFLQLVSSCCVDWMYGHGMKMTRFIAFRHAKLSNKHHEMLKGSELVIVELEAPAQLACQLPTAHAILNNTECIIIYCPLLLASFF